MSAETVNALQKIEWERPGDICPACYARKVKGHDPSCFVAAAVDAVTRGLPPETTRKTYVEIHVEYRTPGEEQWWNWDGPAKTTEEAQRWLSRRQKERPDLEHRISVWLETAETSRVTLPPPSHVSDTLNFPLVAR
jgi:hypothetical protein